MGSHDHETLVESSTNTQAKRRTHWPCVTLLYHPDLRRVGEHCVLSQLSDAPVRICRLEPHFSAPESPRARAIDDPYVSRRPVVLSQSGSRLTIDPGEIKLAIDGEPAVGPSEVPLFALEDGVVLQIGRRVALLLHIVELSERPPRFGLVGDSSAIWGVRRDIARVAELDVAVLIRGETGVGKELVARSVHEASRRANGSMVSVSMATLTPSTAASELFGHERHAFTGAGKRHAGLFEQADGGTLFLDEVGDTPMDIQGMMLRALETGAIRRMGDTEVERKVDVRVLSATDADLQGSAFRDQLYHRLAEFTLHVPPLRDRRSDIPRLVYHFLRMELELLGKTALLEASRQRKPWMPLELMMRMVGYDWPGNVRQLRNAVRKLVIVGRDSDVIAEDALDDVIAIAERPGGRAPSGSDIELAAPVERPARDSKRQRVAHSITDEELEAKMRACRYSIGRAASQLGIPRSTMYDLIKSHPTLRIARDISREEYERCYRECDGDLDRMVEALCVSKRGISLQLSMLDITGASE